MRKLFITEESLKILVKILKKECDEFIAPKKEHLDDIIFGDTKEDAAGELLNYSGNAILSPRTFLLPQTEVLFAIKSAKENKFSAVEDKKRRIFWGVRPCDIKAIGLMRRFFSDEFADTPYQNRLERSVFIALGCSQHCSHGPFCFEMGSGPVAEEGFDLQLMPLNNGFLVEAGSKAGSRIVSRNKKLFSKAAPAQIKEANKLIKDFSKGIKKIDYKKLVKIMQEDKVEEAIWDDIGIRCVICSGCITVCPTCSCFSIADRLHNDSGERLRYCDGCPYAGFTRMAGGSTPKSLHKDHIRRYFEHKLNVDVSRYGVPSCVGCGRCMATCPGNINIRKFIRQVLQLN